MISLVKIRMTSLTIAFLLIFSPLITESLKISRLETHSSGVSIDEHKNDYLKRDLSIRAIPRPDLSIRRIEEQTDNESIEKAVLFNAKHKVPKPKPVNNNISDKNETQSSDSKYKSLAIVWSVCAVIVLSIGLTVLYIHFRKGNNSSEECLNTPNVLQLNTISNNVNIDLDLMSGTHYLNRGVMAFSDITHEIMAVHQNNNLEKAKTPTTSTTTK